MVANRKEFSFLLNFEVHPYFYTFFPEFFVPFDFLMEFLFFSLLFFLGGGGWLNGSHLSRLNGIYSRQVTV